MWGWIRRGGMAALVLAGMAIGGVVWARGSEFLYRSEYFKIKSVRIYGLSDAMDVEVTRSARLDRLESRNLILLDAEALEQRLYRHPKITAVRVTKRYPDTLWIAVRERRPTALVSGAELYAVDAGGYLLEALGSASSGSADLPFLSGVNLEGLGPGDRIESEYLSLALDLLRRTRELNPGLHSILSEIHIDQDDGLTLYLQGGVEARLGCTDPIRAMPVLEAFIKKHPEYDRLTYIDLRFDKQVVYR